MNPDDLPFRLSTITPGKGKGEDGQTRLGVRIDWKGYFEGFCEVHGRFPLVHRGRLLFPDGWQYSMTDYRGPEWAPPDDDEEREKLILVYWKLRRFAIKRELFYARSRLEDLKALQSGRSAPLRQIAVYFDRENGKIRTDRGELDISAYSSRVEWLENALTECDLNLTPQEGDDGTESERPTPGEDPIPVPSPGPLPPRGIPGPDLIEPALPPNGEHVVDPKVVGKGRRKSRPRPKA